MPSEREAGRHKHATTLILNFRSALLLKSIRSAVPQSIASR